MGSRIHRAHCQWEAADVTHLLVFPASAGISGALTSWRNLSIKSPRTRGRYFAPTEVIATLFCPSSAVSSPLVHSF